MEVEQAAGTRQTESPLQQYRHARGLSRWDLALRVVAFTGEHPAIITDLIAQVEEGALGTGDDGSIRLLFALLADDDNYSDELRLRQAQWYGRRKMGVAS